MVKKRFQTFFYASDHSFPYHSSSLYATFLYEVKQPYDAIILQFPFLSNFLLPSLHPGELFLWRHRILSKGCLPAPQQ